MSEDLEQIVRRKLLEPVPGAERFADDVRKNSAHSHEPEAILLYGSTLSAATRSSTSIHDVYAVVENLRAFHRRRLQAVLNVILPPNVYFRTFHHEGLTHRYKLCVISTADLKHETSERAGDLHHLGRFSKHMSVIAYRDEASLRRVVNCCISALRVMSSFALVRLGQRFTLDDFALALLGLSYVAETRVTEAGKVAAIFHGEHEYYGQVFHCLLSELGLTHDGGAWLQPRASLAQKRQLERLLARSRRRERLRWPKYIFTFDNWLDYLLDKLERHHGIRLELTERQRRWPLIFAWGKYFELRRRGIVK